MSNQSIAIGYREYSGKEMTPDEYAEYIAEQERKIEASRIAYEAHLRYERLPHVRCWRWFNAANIHNEGMFSAWMRLVVYIALGNVLFFGVFYGLLRAAL